MRKSLWQAPVVALAIAGLLLPGSVETAASAGSPTHDIQVVGVGASIYPAFSPAVSRYGVTTTGATNGTLTVTARTDDAAGRVWVDGRTATGPVTVTGLEPGEEVSVQIADSTGVTQHALVYLPPGFPTLAAKVTDPTYVPDWVALTLTRWFDGSPSFEAVVDGHGVPGYVAGGSGIPHDLKPLPSGGWSVARPTTTPGRTGSDIVVLDEQFRPVKSLRTQDLVDTDLHDAIVRPDGSVILVAYEYREGVKLPNDTTQRDAVIQEIAPDGTVRYTWNSGDHIDPMEETVAPQNGDYAHINSIQQVEGGDIIASFRHFSSVYRIAWSDRSGVTRGDVIWKLGGRNSTFAFVDDLAQAPGPCAQHSATMLPSGNVLLFDNGSADLLNAMCVDPAQPHEPPIQRTQSRAVEYALDEEAGTAKVVWSDTLDRFTFFAGSTYRQADGSTLTSYAVDKRALARVSEPDDGTTVWELRDAVNDGLPNNPNDTYGTYRAHEAPNPDAFAPTAAIESPAHGQILHIGDPLVLKAHCTDRGGSTLRACSAGELRSGDSLDTSTPGRHTVVVTAVDGAGHHTTDTVTYTVQPTPTTPSAPPTPTTSPAPPVELVSRPDLAVRASKGWIGGGNYSANQRTTQRLSLRRGTHRIHLRIVNRGTTTEAFTVRGPRSNKRFRLRYVERGTNVTRRVTKGTHQTRVLAPGESVRLNVIVHRSKRTRPGHSRMFRVRIAASVEPSLTDSIQIRVRARRT